MNEETFWFFLLNVIESKNKYIVADNDPKAIDRNEGTRGVMVHCPDEVVQRVVLVSEPHLSGAYAEFLMGVPSRRVLVLHVTIQCPWPCMYSKQAGIMHHCGLDANVNTFLK